MNTTEYEWICPSVYQIKILVSKMFIHDRIMSNENRNRADIHDDFLIKFSNANCEQWTWFHISTQWHHWQRTRLELYYMKMNVVVTMRYFQSSSHESSLTRKTFNFNAIFFAIVPFIETFEIIHIVCYQTYYMLTSPILNDIRGKLFPRLHICEPRIYIEWLISA